ncbi:hypothetical protein B0H13DRAFT_2315119 [Mycena leptocephala]|nr:hypothetical protein B0H13DRAFT_2315119 [Mycena leptocephala]
MKTEKYSVFKPGAAKEGTKPPPLKRTPAPSWKDIIKECCAASDAKGVYRKAIKKFALEKYHICDEKSQLNRAIIYGVDAGIFVQANGTSGPIKLAPNLCTQSNEAWTFALRYPTASLILSAELCTRVKLRCHGDQREEAAGRKSGGCGYEKVTDG